jgi:hypothetical protein
VFKMIGGSSFLVDTCNNFKTSLLTEGIFHISVTEADIFSFPNMAATFIFNLISYVGFVLGSNSCTRCGGGGTTFSIDGGGVASCDGGEEALFLLV